MALALVLSVTSCATFKSSPKHAINVDALLEEMPSQSIEANNRFGDIIFDIGPGAITAICNKLVPAGTGDDTQARFALSGLAKYANRPHARSDRKVFANAIIDALNAQDNIKVQAFLIRQLQVAGKNETVDTLRSYLSDDALCSPATQALQAIGTRKASRAIHEGALSATSNSQRVTLLKALAELEYKEAQPLFEHYAAHSDRDVRFAALLGLATLAHPDSEATLKTATQSGSDYDKIEAQALYGLYTRNGDR